MYGRLFVWLFKRMNSTIHKQQTNDALNIGLLDIFGFENFKKNRSVTHHLMAKPKMN